MCDRDFAIDNTARVMIKIENQNKSAKKLMKNDNSSLLYQYLLRKNYLRAL
jgi:hypothetical protein